MLLDDAVDILLHGLDLLQLLLRQALGNVLVEHRVALAFGHGVVVFAWLHDTLLELGLEGGDMVLGTGSPGLLARLRSSMRGLLRVEALDVELHLALASDLGFGKELGCSGVAGLLLVEGRLWYLGSVEAGEESSSGAGWWHVSVWVGVFKTNYKKSGSRPYKKPLKIAFSLKGF